MLLNQCLVSTYRKRQVSFELEDHLKFIKDRGIRLTMLRPKEVISQPTRSIMVVTRVVAVLPIIVYSLIRS